MKSMFTKRKSIQLPFTLVIVAVALVLWLVLRVVLWIQVGPSQMFGFQSASAFVRGEWFDLATLAYLLVPVLLFAAVIPNALRAWSVMAMLRWMTVAIVIGGLLFGAVAEFVFWDEFTTRFNFIAIDYLIYTTEVVRNILESYPLILVIAIFLLLRFFFFVAQSCLLA